MTNEQLIERVEKAMRFLRTCGTDHGRQQADDLAVLCKRIRIYESKLVQFNSSTEEILPDAGIAKGI